MVDANEESPHREWEFDGNAQTRYVVSEAYPWGTRWYVWRDDRQPDDSWPYEGVQCGGACRSLGVACARAERLAKKLRAAGQPGDEEGEGR
jgi:hypothetical protein